MKEIVDYILRLLKDPASFELHRQEHEEKLLLLLNAYADNRPPSIDQMIELLEDQYPGLRSSVDLISKGDTLRTEMLDAVFSDDFNIDQSKTYEARISLFDKMISFDKTINTLIQNLSGTYTQTKKKHRGNEVDGSQGSAQSILSQIDGKKSGTY